VAKKIRNPRRTLTDQERCHTRARYADDFEGWSTEDLEAELAALEDYDARGSAAEEATGQRPEWFNPWCRVTEAHVLRRLIEKRKEPRG
jgi:hypothetical protein